LRAAGLPEGVFQVVQGRAETGRLLTRHPDIRKISLTGEVGTGKAVMGRWRPPSLKQVTLELGGKSPLIVFEDAKLDKRRGGRALLGNFLLGGGKCARTARACSCTAMCTRPSWSACVRAPAAMRVGDPMDPATPGGSADFRRSNLEKVLGFIARGRAQGARGCSRAGAPA